MSETKSFRDKVATYFKSRPNVWIDAVSLEFLGGRQAWRTRVSDCRTELGMVIENRVRRERGHADNCPALQAWDIPRACNCELPKRYTVSQYRYVPPIAPAEDAPHDLNVSWQLRS